MADVTDRVVVRDVVLRDGLQDEPVVVPIEGRVRIAEALVAAGVMHLEAASFVNPARVPQMAGAERLLRELRARSRTGRACLSALALNAKGVARGMGAGVDELQLVVSAAEGHSRANAGRGVSEAMADFAGAVAGAVTVAGAGPRHGPRLTAAVATAFRCPFDGEVPPARLVEVVAGWVRVGVSRIGLADTVGDASPERVIGSVAAVRSAFPDVELALHLHDGLGQAIRTVDAALELGVRHFDAAVGGYGGCPFAPGAHGNLATERLVAHLHAAGLSTGIDVDGLGSALDVVRRELAVAPPVGQHIEER